MRPDERMIFGSLDWQKDQHHKRFRPKGIVKHRRLFSSHAMDAAMQAAHQAELDAAAKDAEEFAAFERALDLVKSNVRTIQQLLEVHRNCFPRKVTL